MEEMLNVVGFHNDKFGAIRSITLNDKPHIVATDIAKILGYKNPQKAIRTHCKHQATTTIQTPGGLQQMIVIPEGDIYRLILKSSMKQAEEFEAWVTDTVLPQIRQTGGYIPTDASDSDAELMAKALIVAKNTIDLKDKLIASQQPKVDYHDDVLQSPKLISSTDIAKDLGMSAIALHKLLSDKGIIYKRYRDKCWKFYSKYQKMIPEYADYHITPYSQALKWTEKGRKFIIDLVNDQSIITANKKINQDVNMEQVVMEEAK
jgi:anti-repressor protein